MVASEVEFGASFETNFFRIAIILEAETSVSGKGECEDKKVSFLVGSPVMSAEINRSF